VLERERARATAAPVLQATSDALAERLATAVVEARATAAQVTSEPQSGPAGLRGAVLGADRATWIVERGPPSPSAIPGRERFGGGVDVHWVRDAAGTERAGQVELHFNQLETTVAARMQADRYQPEDAQPVGMTRTPEAQTIERFKSAALAALPPTAFGSAEPGTFVRIIERVGGSNTRRVVLVLGDTPP
jgi:hypothetical protein